MEDEQQEMKQSSSETMGQNTRNRVKSEKGNWRWLARQNDKGKIQDWIKDSLWRKGSNK